MAYTLLQQQLKDAVVNSLNNEIYDNAAFLAERLFAEVKNEEVRLLLAECYSRNKKPSKAYEILKDCKSAENRYKHALICMTMNKFEEAEKALVNNRFSQPKVYGKENTERQIPKGAAGYYLLGQIYQKKEKQKEASTCYRKALNLDPTMWSAFEKLVELEQEVDVDSIFVFNENMPETLVAKQNKPLVPYSTSELYNAQGISTPKVGAQNDAYQKYETENQIYVCSPIHEKPDNEAMYEQNTPGASNSNYVTPQATGKNTRRLADIGTNAPHQLHHESKLSGISPNAKMSLNDSSSGYIASEGFPKPSGHSGTDHIINPFKMTSSSVPGNASISKSPLSSKVNNTEEYDQVDLMWLLRKIGLAYMKQINYECVEAIDLYEKLPLNQRQTGWVLTQLGCCNMDIQNFYEAEKWFKEMRDKEKYTIEGLHHYSTLLWHLKKHVELCQLSNFALKKNVLVPDTWIIVGNCYALQNEHEAAIKYFRRAIQINRYCGMAYTLLGHEYFEIEDFEQAELNYKRGYTVDKRNYKSWWGVGNIHMKQEKFEQAIKYFTMAAKIHPKSAFLHTYIGMAYMKSNNTKKALEQFDIAERFNKDAPLNLFMKVQAYTSQDKDEEALELLTKLIKTHSKEPSLYIHRGQIMKKLGQKAEALKDFNIALDLDPKDSNMVKNMIEKLGNDCEMGEDAEI